MLSREADIRYELDLAREMLSSAEHNWAAGNRRHRRRGRLLRGLPLSDGPVADRKRQTDRRSGVSAQFEAMTAHGRLVGHQYHRQCDELFRLPAR